MSEASVPTIERAYRVRLHPNEAQAATLRRLFGARRFVWNWAIRRQREARAEGVMLNAVALSREFTQLRQAEATAWLSELPREPFNQTLRDLDRAWTNWRRGDAKPPTRKRFGTVQRARFTLDQRRAQVRIAAGSRSARVQLDGIGAVKLRTSEPMPGRLRSVTVTRDSAGRWWASFTADGVPAPAITPAACIAVGIDLGLKDTAVFSTGAVITATKALTSKLKKLRRYQRRQSRQLAAQLVKQGLDPKQKIPKGTRLEVSNRRRKTQRRIGVLHARIADARRNHQHQVSTAAIRTAEVIVLEDLNLKAMSRTLHRGFRRSVADAGLGELRRQIGYKAAWHRRTVVTVDRWYPSSKTCSACGTVNAALALGDRAWRCACGAAHDRDRNAAKNLEREGLRLLAEGTAPEGGTPRNGGTNARRAAKAGRRNPSRREASALKRELASRDAPHRTTTEAASRRRRDRGGG